MSNLEGWSEFQSALAELAAISGAGGGGGGGGSASEPGSYYVTPKEGGETKLFGPADSHDLMTGQTRDEYVFVPAN